MYRMSHNVLQIENCGLMKLNVVRLGDTVEHILPTNADYIVYTHYVFA